LAFSYPRCFRPALLLGLDIDHAAIRMVELSQRPDRRFQLERCAQAALPAGTVTDEHIHHPGRLAEHIGALAQRLGARSKRVALALPAHAVVTRPMRVPAEISEAALDQLATAEASGYLTVAPGDVRVDYQFVHTDAGDPAQRDIVLAAAHREQVEDRVAAVETAGLIPVVLDIDLHAAHAACMQAGAAAAPGALLLLDATLNKIALFDRHRLLSHRELPDCNAATDAQQIAAAVKRAIQLAGDGAPPEHIYIGGDYPAHALLTQAMQEQCGVSCSIVDPFAAMPRGKRFAPPAGESGAGSYLVACGLAMRRAAR
jgi:type IV pilus assembly protein PilM